MKRLITFGCSFSKDNYQQTWCDLLSRELGMPLSNRAERGCGADFVSSRVLASTDLDPADDLVVIMWPSADRYDLWADQTVPHLLDDIDTCSWPDGRSPQLINYAGDYTLDHGFILNGSVPRGHKHYYYKHFFSASQCVHNWYKSIILTQLYLTSKNIKFVMANAFPLRNPIHYHHDHFEIVEKVYAEINLSAFVPTAEQDGFFNFCQTRNLPFLDSHHPKTPAHAVWMKEILLPKVAKIMLTY